MSHTFHRLQVRQLCIVWVMLMRMMTRQTIMDDRIQITSLELLLHESSTAFTINYYQTEQLRDNAML